MDAEQRRRRLACCDAEPPCLLCPMRPENAHRTLKDLAEAGLYANVRAALAAEDGAA